MFSNCCEPVSRRAKQTEIDSCGRLAASFVCLLVLSAIEKDVVWALFEITCFVTEGVTAAQRRVHLSLAGCWQHSSTAGVLPLVVRSGLLPSPLAEVEEGQRWGNG